MPHSIWFAGQKRADNCAQTKTHRQKRATVTRRQMRADKCAQHYNQCIYKIHVHDSLQSIKHNQCKITNERYHDKAKKLQEPKDTKTLVMPIVIVTSSLKVQCCVQHL